MRFKKIGNRTLKYTLSSVCGLQNISVSLLVRYLEWYDFLHIILKKVIGVENPSLCMCVVVYSWQSYHYEKKTRKVISMKKKKLMTSILIFSELISVDSFHVMLVPAFFLSSLTSSL